MHCFRLNVTLAAIICAVAWGQLNFPARGNQKNSQSSAPFAISKKTTYLTTPLRPDGYVDYVKALNLRYAEGTTPENNAAVLFVRAAGLGEVAEEHRYRCLAALEIDKLPESENLFIPFADYLDKGLARDARERLLKDQSTAMTRAWSEKEFPDLARWLAKNESALRLIVEGCRRPRYFFPLMPDGMEGTIISTTLPQTQQLREFARALAGRAMLRLHQGDAEGAWQDVLACHQLSRHAGRGPTLIQRLVGVAIDGVAGAATVQLAHSGKLTSAQAAAFQATLEKLPPLSTMAAAFNEGERFMFLDSVGLFTRNDGAALETLGLDPNDAASKTLKRALVNVAVDWDKILIDGNKWYDRLYEAARLPDRQQRLAAFKKLDGELKERAKAASAGGLAKSFLTFRPISKTTAEIIGSVMIALMTPACEAAQTAEDRSQMSRELTLIALGLAAYHHDRGTYPKLLSELTPQYVAAVPRDLFSNKDLIYRATGTGYVLYSVGANGQDDNGTGYQDQPSGDDLVVRLLP